MDDYVDVAERLSIFRELYPNGSLQPWDPMRPYAIETLGDQVYVVVVAAAYRDPDDCRPGVGMAYEVFPGRTQFTKGSELQNAETSAWGRAVVAALAADTKRGIASAQEVRNRVAERDADDARASLLRTVERLGVSSTAAAEQFASEGHGDIRTSTDVTAINALADYYLNGGDS